MDKIDKNKIIKVKSTKVVEQYIELYEQYKQKLNTNKVTIMMQVGDFYEIYGLIYSDGTRRGNLWEIADDLVLKVANKSQMVFNDKSISVKMAGIPIASLDKHLNLAIENYAWTIVVISQVGDGKDIVRYEDFIVSPGLNLQTSEETNNLMTIYLEKISSYQFQNTKTLYAGISFLDCLTGESGIIQYPYKSSISDEIIYDEILKLITIKNPAEIIIYSDNVGKTESEIVNLFHLQMRNYKIIIDNTPPNFTKSDYQSALFNTIYKKSLDSQNIFNYLELYEFPNGRVSLTILLDYVVKRNKSVLDKIQKPKLMYEIDTNLVLANNALEQLNIINHFKRNFHYQQYTSLYDIINKTKTLMGRRILKDRLMNPITSIDILNQRYSRISNMIELASSHNLINEIRTYLQNMVDFKRVVRLFCRNSITIYNLDHFKSSLENTLDLSNFLDNLKLADTNVIKSIFLEEKVIKMINQLIGDMTNTFNLEYCQNSINKLETNIFKKNINKRLDELQQKIDVDKNLIDLLCEKLSIVIDKNAYNKDKKSLINKGQNSKYNHYIYTTQARADTLKKIINSGNFKTIEVGHYKITKKDFYFDVISKNKVRIDLECIQSSGNNLILNTDRMRREISNQFNHWIKCISDKYSDMLLELNDFISEIDFIQSCAKVAIENCYCRPEIDDSVDFSYLDVKDIRHPIIEKIQTDIQYVTNDVNMGQEINGVLLFGINAVGKSSYMKSIGVNIIMAQAGMYVASSLFKYKPFKYLFTRILSNDNLFAGLSTFAVEMSEFKIIMKYADRNSIVLGDELCSGTETLDATALVAAGIKKLAGRKANFIFATHLHHLSSSKHINDLQNVKKIHMSVSYDSANDKLIYERKLKDGSGPSSYGIEVCKSMNMNSDYMELAQQIRDELSDETTKILGKQSKYNTGKFVSQCEVCRNNVATDTHHIKFQCTANKNDIIDNFHKDSKFNLVGLCKECHNAVHASPPKMKIDGYIMTSDGIELKWYKLNGEKEKKKEEVVKNIDYHKLIKELKGELTVKQIQNRLREQYKYKISQNDIKKIITN